MASGWRCWRRARFAARAREGRRRNAAAVGRAHGDATGPGAAETQRAGAAAAVVAAAAPGSG